MRYFASCQPECKTFACFPAVNLQINFAFGYSGQLCDNRTQFDNHVVAVSTPGKGMLLAYVRNEAMLSAPRSTSELVTPRQHGLLRKHFLLFQNGKLLNDDVRVLDCVYYPLSLPAFYVRIAA